MLIRRPERLPARNTIATFVLLALLLLPNPSTGQSGYTWRSVIAGGGGFIPGIIYHPAAKGLAYARTDMGGAYRWDNSTGSWIPLTDMMDRTNSDYMGILSIAVDPADTNRLYMECGKYTQSWAGTGAVLSSTNRGNSWTINPLAVKIGGNEDGRGAGERLQVDPNADSILIMATTANGLWKSTDFAATWTKMSSLAPANLNFVLFDPASSSPGNPTQRIFAAAVNTAGQSLYRSDDGGSSWSLVPGQPTGAMAIRAVISDTLLYLTFANYQGPNSATAGSVWRYAIPGGAWTNISPSSGSYGFSGISLYPANPNIIVVSTLDRWSPMDEVYMSTNAGATWTPRLTIAALNHSYAPYTSTITPHWLGCVAMDPFDSGKVMFGTGYGIWACDNFTSAAPVWYFKDQNLEETVPMQIVSPPFAPLLSAMGDIDGFKHLDVDLSPPNRYSPAKGTTLSIAFAGRVPSRVVKAFNSKPYGAYSTDGGSSWRDFIAGRGGASYPSGATAGGSWAIAISADAGSIVWGPTGAAMSYSTDNGRTWTKCGGGVPLLSPVADRVNGNKFYAYAGGSGEMWVSLDGGKTFNAGASGLPAVSQAQDGNVTAVPGYEGELMICCGAGGLYRSVNSGASASKINSVSAAYRMGFGKSKNAGDYPALYLHGSVGGVLGIFRSDDAGVSWNRINDDIHQFGWVHQITGDPRIYGRCYLSAEGRGIVYGQPEAGDTSDNPSSFNYGLNAGDSLRKYSQKITLTWSRASDPQARSLTYVTHFFGPGVDTSFISTDTTVTFSAPGIQPLSSYIAAGCVTNGFDTTASSNSITYLTASLLTKAVDPALAPPGRFALNQNYPNPFNPSTTIGFDIPSRLHVTLALFDMLGRQVQRLVNDQTSPGHHQVTFDGSRLASGVYFYKLTAGPFTSTKELMLIK